MSNFVLKRKYMCLNVIRKAVSIPTIVIKVRGNDLMVFDIWCEKGLYAIFHHGI